MHGIIKIGCVLGFLSMASALNAQFSPEQLKLKEDFLRQRQASTDPNSADKTEQYKSQTTFSSQDADYYTPPDGSLPPADVQKIQVDESRALGGDLKIFGNSLFEGSAESFSPILEATPPSDYKLGPGDNIMVNLWGRVDMQLDLTIDREGKVFIPKVGEISAWGLTLDDFKGLLQRRLSDVYSDFQLSVTLGKIRRIKVFVYGEVKRPGGYTTSSLATLFNALYLSGGPNRTGSLRAIKHVRNNKIIAEIDLYRFLLNGDNSQDSKLESGDVIFVPVVGPLVRVYGQVKRPAIYEIAGGEKISDLIALAGGSTAEAFLEMVSVDRVGQDDNRLIQDVDLSGIDNSEQSEEFARANLVLQDGDRISIPSIFDFRKNTVTLTGNVKHPGLFGLSDSMKVSDLIAAGEQFRRDTYLERANLFRTFPDQRREVYPVHLDEILQGVDSTDYCLMEKDSLVIYSQNEIKRDMTVTIHGAVKRPGVYEYFENMKLSDLVFLSGNPLKQSYLLQAEIARVVPGQPADVIFANLEKILGEKDSSEDILLQEDDNVFIRTIPRWRLDYSVKIEGEVMFPGSYEISKDGERLSDILERAGWFTPDAFPEGLVFIRSSISEEVEKRQARSVLALSEMTVLDSLNRPIPKLNETLDINSANRIIINPLEVLRNPKSPDNVTLQSGDYVFVPKRPAGIQVLGAVASNGTLVYTKGKKLSHFIKSSGGFSRNADKSQTRLIKANGKVMAGGQAFKGKIDPGDIIVVPQKLKRDKQWLRSAGSVAAIASTVLTAFLLVDRVK